MTYNQYVEEIFRKRLALEWTHPYRWSISNGLSALSLAVEKALGRPDDNSTGRKLRSGFLCRGRDTEWSWLLLKQDFEWLTQAGSKYKESFEAFCREYIPRHKGMVGSALDTISDPTKFKDRGGLFNTLEHSKWIEGESYSPTLQDAERHLWPIDEFISLMLLGVASRSDQSMKLDTEIDNLDDLPDGGIAIVFVFSVGKEPLAPERVTDTVSLISESKRFFGHFLEENSPLLQVSADALAGSAVAAVMARNMSHNIGSHVSQRTTIGAIEERLSELLDCPEKAPDAEERLLIVRTLRKRLDEYIQKKADFLAEITTEPLTTSKTARFFREAILPFVSNTLLVDTLGANEGLRYRTVTEPSLLLRCCYNGREVLATIAESAAALTSENTYRYTYPPQLPYTLFPVVPPEESIGARRELQVFNTHFRDGTDFEDFEVELPGPLGEFAFFALMENLVRNSAKHNRSVFSQTHLPNLEITIDVQEREFDAYEISIYDNVTDPDKDVGPASEGYENETVCQRLERLVTAPLIDADGHIRKSAWGVAEMRICATLLAGSTDFVKAQPLSVIKGFDPTSGKSRLIYKFNLLKPKKVCAVVRPNLDSDKVAELKRSGIYVFHDVATAKVYLESTKQSAASFQFFLMDCGVCDSCDCDGVFDFIHELPFRRIITSRTSCNKLDNLIDQHAVHRASDNPIWSGRAVELDHWCWRTWTDRWLATADGNKTAMEVHVYLDQKITDHQTEHWQAASQAFSGDSRNSAVQTYVWGTDSRASIPRTSLCPRLFIDRHLNFLSGIAHFDGRLFGQDTCILLDKNNSDFLKLFQPAIGPDLPLWSLPYQLAEAGLLRVAVIDERLAEAAVRGLDDGKIGPYVCDGKPQRFPCVWHMAMAANVFICTHLQIYHDGASFSDALHASSFLDRERTAETNRMAVPFFEMTFDGRMTTRWSTDRKIVPERSFDKPFDVLVIHQGILDTVEHDLHCSAEELLKRLSHSIPFLVVDSGRGIPPNLPQNAKFLPFSLLQNYIGDMRTAKFSLTQVLMSLTRRNRGM